MKKITFLVFLILSFMTNYMKAQSVSNSSIEKASSFLKTQGYEVYPNGNGLIASSTDIELSLNVYSDASLPLPLLRLTTCVATYDATDLIVLSFVNGLNSNCPAIKFTVSATEKGDYAYESGGSPTDILYSIYATLDQYYSSDDAMMKILNAYSKSFKEIKMQMPANINQ